MTAAANPNILARNSRSLTSIRDIVNSCKSLIDSSPEIVKINALKKEELAKEWTAGKCVYTQP